jgi:hypothetical protein
MRESPRGWKAQESRRPRPGLNLRGSRKGYGFSGGMKPLKRRCEGVRFRKEAQERRVEGKLSYDPLRGGKL